MTLGAAAELALEAEAELRTLLVDSAASFPDTERVAVLAGAVGVGPGSREVPSGRWSLHPDGYYVRYLPHGYTVPQVWVPQGGPPWGRSTTRPSTSPCRALRPASGSSSWAAGTRTSGPLQFGHFSTGETTGF